MQIKRIVDAGFVNLLAIIGIFSIWHIYAAPWFVLVSAVSLVVANLLAFLKIKFGLNRKIFAAMIAISYLLVGILFSAPSIYGAPTKSWPTILQVVTAPVTGWKQLLTLDLPLGSYQATLAPTVFLIIVTVSTALTLMQAKSSIWVLSIPILLTLTAFGIVFGSSSVSDGFVTGVYQLLVGLAALVTALAMIIWRGASERALQLKLATQATVGRSRGKRVKAVRFFSGFGMVTVAVIAALFLSPAIVSGVQRDVLRSGIDPQRQVNAQMSPLSTYRQYFADENFDEVLFNVTSGEEVERISLAVMSFYDGQTLTVLNQDTGTASGRELFARVPATLSRGNDDGTLIKVDIAGLRGVWVPLSGELKSLSFTGAGKTAFEDGFFYHTESGTGVQLAKVNSLQGSSYEISSVINLLSTEEAAGFQALNDASRLPSNTIPPALEPWVRAQQVSQDARGLLELIERLRERGYLSHSFYFEEGETPKWMQQLDDFNFEPSRAGHSTGRINTVFETLLEKQEQVGADAPEELLVAAIGDDEQFAVAAMLLADHFGFKARVALGARVNECNDGACVGANMTAWLEIQDAATGDWAAIDVTPQHLNKPTPDTKQRSDPENATSVLPENPDQVRPPEPSPAAVAEQSETDEKESTGLLWLVPLLRGLGIGILAALVLVSPLLIIVGAKILRRALRRGAKEPEEQIVLGWHEYVDHSVDLGRPQPSKQTRHELALLYENDVAVSLAGYADEAVFASVPPSREFAAYYWKLVDEARKADLAGVRGLKKIKVWLNLRSLKNEAIRIKNEADRVGN